MTTTTSSGWPTTTSLVEPGHAARQQDRLLLLRHDAVVPVAAARPEVGAVFAIGLRHVPLDLTPDGHLGRLGRPVPVELRLPMDRRHGAAVGHVHAAVRRRPLRRLLQREEPSRTTAATCACPSATRAVRVLGGGSTADDYRPTAYASDAAWGLGAGLSPGCDPRLFCTYNVTHRDELAGSFSRLMDLAAANQDFFDDDEVHGSSRTDRVAEAGIMTAGAPASSVHVRCHAAIPRGDARSRSEELPSSSTDHYDDDGIGAEASVNAVADAGLIDRPVRHGPDLPDEDGHPGRDGAHPARAFT